MQLFKDKNTNGRRSRMRLALRKYVNPATLLSTVALLFAMAGGAYAASKYLITSKKQISPKVLKQLKGKNGKNGAAGSTGPQGPAGAQGPTGPAGKAGANGSDGTNGAPGEQGAAGLNGKSVVVTAEAPGANCVEGGTSFEVEGSKAKSYACNGYGGAGTLPPGRTETGIFAGETPTQSGAKTYTALSVAISFPIPLAEELPETALVKVEPEATGPAECEDGTVEDPKAAPGHLCVYFKAVVGTGGGESETPLLESLYSFSPESSEHYFYIGKHGVLLRSGSTSETASVRGTWAVTAPAAP